MPRSPGGTNGGATGGFPRGGLPAGGMRGGGMGGLLDAVTVSDQMKALLQADADNNQQGRAAEGHLSSPEAQRDDQERGQQRNNHEVDGTGARNAVDDVAQVLSGGAASAVARDEAAVALHIVRDLFRVEGDRGVDEREDAVADAAFSDEFAQPHDDRGTCRHHDHHDKEAGHRVISNDALRRSSSGVVGKTRYLGIRTVESVPESRSNMRVSVTSLMSLQEE